MIRQSSLLRLSRTQSKIKNRKHICERKNARRIFVKIYNIDPYFCEHYKEKIQVDKNGCEYISFRIDVYFTEYLLAIEIDEKKNMFTETLFLRRKSKKHKKKNLVINLSELIRVSVMMKITKLVEYRHLSVNLKTDN